MTTDKFKLHDGEYKLVEIVWDQEPIPSGKLARECLKLLNWQRTTTYTVLKKLCDRGILQNHQATVTSLVTKEQVQRYESRSVLNSRFDGSLPRFIAAFISDSQLTPKERAEIMQLLNEKELAPEEAKDKE